MFISPVCVMRVGGAGEGGTGGGRSRGGGKGERVTGSTARRVTDRRCFVLLTV